ncbi:hypothetical protein GCM10025870_21810 [Agromyces marinus]|uniref:Uncharacterized protein n=1 Tax=Agromyces marinus TaxID=1389020 RepID=A0ABN6YD43_9MICO|nr:hypothetical protein [Agromyces marinus]BDZ55108.1 hypothetical protein GCM10025870_21810 [Agromyces marinus]
MGDVFQGRGRALPQVLARTGRPIPEGMARRVLRDRDIHPATRPSGLATEDWVELWRLARDRPTGPGLRSRTS